jgi:pyroglutamyl-peptidase
VAINLDDARIADNRGAQPVDQAILADAPAAYFTRLPVKNLVAAMVATGVPAAVSYSAGTFVCNHLMFRLEHLCATERPDLVTGFLHVPVLEAMELPTTLRGLIAVLKLLASRTSTGW